MRPLLFGSLGKKSPDFSLARKLTSLRTGCLASSSIALCVVGPVGEFSPVSALDGWTHAHTATIRPHWRMFSVSPHGIIEIVAGAHASRGRNR